VFLQAEIAAMVKIFEKKRRITEWQASFFAAFQKFAFGAQDWTRTSMPLGAAT
jgi:hypothetical protein